MSTAAPTSSNVSITLRADGKNWKDWDKQLCNCAMAISAATVLTEGTIPHYDEASGLYTQLDLTQPNLSDSTMTPAQIMAELQRVEEINKYMRPVNKDRKERNDTDRKAREDWLVRDARLQNIILSSVDKALTSQLRSCNTAYGMHTLLNQLNHSSDHANAAIAWASFVDLRADNCTSIRQYLGKFREAIADVTVAGINISWKKPGQSWTIDALIASVEDHIRHTNQEPLRTFTTVAKQQEEKRILARVKQQQQPGPQRAPKTHCEHCGKEHAGGAASCWKLHPEQIPERRKNTWNKPRTNVTITGAAGPRYGNYVYASIASVSPNLLSKAISNNEYKQRYCYDTAANRHVFNDR
ncbi:hypothetical protein EJ02DRAFT_318242, partial [Clathrospora elynae]